MPSDVGGHEPGPTGGAQKGRSLHTFRSFYVDVIDFILFNSCRSQFLPQSQVSQKKETMPRGQRTRETQHLLTPSASCPSWTSPCESAFSDGAEILLKMPCSKEGVDAADNETYTSLETGI